MVSLRQGREAPNICFHSFVENIAIHPLVYGSSLPPWVVGLPHLTDVRDTVRVAGFGARGAGSPALAALSYLQGRSFVVLGGGMWPRVPSLHLGCLRPRGGVLTRPSCSGCRFWRAGSLPSCPSTDAPRSPAPGHPESRSWVLLRWPARRPAPGSLHIKNGPESGTQRGRSPDRPWAWGHSAATSGLWHCARRSREICVC